MATVEGAQAAYDSVAELRREPAGLVRLSSLVLLTQRCLVHALSGYTTAHPKVSIFVEPSATRRAVEVTDMDEKRAASAVRLSPHYYNTDGELAAAVDALKSLSARATHT